MDIKGVYGARHEAALAAERMRLKLVFINPLNPINAIKDNEDEVIQMNG